MPKIIKKVDPQGVTPKQLDLLFIQDNRCFICNGYYGPCFEEPCCAICHDFLFPNAAPDIRILTMLEQDSSDDSDSGDRPTNNTVRATDSHCHISENNNAVSHVHVEGLTKHIDQQEFKVNIELVPDEILLLIFKNLDGMSLWSVGQVCWRWKKIVTWEFKEYYWNDLVRQHWPLWMFYNMTGNKLCTGYELYSIIVKSCWCIKCIRQMTEKETTPGEENLTRLRRINNELLAIIMSPFDDIRVIPLDSTACHWQATIKGPNNSPYEGGLFFLYIQVPYTYPVCPPLVRLLTKIFHPNISRHGDIGLDCINNNWHTSLSLIKILICIKSLLTDPFCDVCMEPDVGLLYVKNRPMFEQQARRWTMKYAMHQSKFRCIQL